MPKNSEKCENCFYSGIDESRTESGYIKAVQCRRFPPSVEDGKVTDTKGKVMAKYYDHPWVNLEGWCGEHKPQKT